MAKSSSSDGRSHLRLVDLYLKKYPDTRYSLGEWKRYDGQVWQALADLTVRKECQTLCRNVGGLPITSTVVGSIYKLLQAEVFLTDDTFDQNSDLIAFTDKTLVVSTGEVRSHRATDYLTSHLPFSYNPHAQLKFFDTESMINAYVSGRLVSRLARIGAKVRNLYIDEVSMMPAEQLDTLYQAVQEANRRKMVTRTSPDGLGIVLVGDLCQLPPIKARWLFDAECWKEFEKGTTRLEKNWRQADGEFLAAINYLRAGRGEQGAETLRQTTTEFTSALDLNFPGTTIMAKNDEVDRFNWQALQRVRGEKFAVNSKRWHVAKPPGEWKNIPERLELKIGAYVMILANDTREFTYANGDCGMVVGRDSISVQVRLARNDEVVDIGTIERKVHSPDNDGFDKKRIPKTPTWGEPWFDELAEKYCIGSVRYLPLRLAWASTVHKSQGLTLDRVQLDLRNHFFSQPAMAYVAVSRCRTPEGLRIVGDEALLAKRCKIDPRVERWV